MENRNRKKIAPIVVAVLVVAYVLPLVGMVAYAAGLLGSTDGGGGLLPFLLLYAAIGGAVIIGVLYAMAQRLREIDGGEEDEAKKY